MTAWELHTGPAAKVLRSGVVAARSVAAVVTSPPYFALRDYSDDAAEIGDPAHGVRQYVDDVVDVLEACRPLLVRGGVVWVNVGDTFNAYNHNRGPGGAASARRDASRARQGRGLTSPEHRNKTALGIPQRLAVALVDAGWILRADITWQRHTLPERVRDRPRRASERLLLLAADDRYAARTPDDPRLATDVWSIPSASGTSDHPARYSPALAGACLSWVPEDVVGDVLDPFSGSGSTGLAALDAGRRYVGVDLVPAFNAEAARTLAAHGRRLQ